MRVTRVFVIILVSWLLLICGEELYGFNQFNHALVSELVFERKVDAQSIRNPWHKALNLGVVDTHSLKCTCL